MSKDEAIECAAWLESAWGNDGTPLSTQWELRSATELRRLHEVNVELLAALKDTLYFLERHSNRWDGVNGKHPFTVVEAARAVVLRETGDNT